MPTQIAHNGGLVDAVIELGFDAVKYFEITASGTSQLLTLSPPARRLTLYNADGTNDFYFNVVDDVAVASAGSMPGDNIKLRSGSVFVMDFDTLASVAFVTTGSDVLVEGILGWKGTA